MPMRFPYLKSARVKLQEKKNACIRSTYETADTYTNYFLQFIRSNPVIKPIVVELEVIKVQKFQSIESLIERRRLKLPTTPTDCAAFHLRFLEAMADPKPDSIPEFTWVFAGGSRTYQDKTDDFFEQILIPFCAYLDERIDDGDLLLYMLCRYQRECMWFEGPSLAALVKSADSHKLESECDNHLRTWLFREGIDYPFSTPKSPSGRADVVVWQGEEPLPIEVKVFDGENRGTGHVTQGLSQAQRYATDYGKPFGYLVVFNTSDKSLAFSETVSKDVPPCVEVGGILVFAVVIDVGAERLSASVEKPRETKSVKKPGT